MEADKLRDEYLKLKKNREDYLTSARDYSKLTIPTIEPEEGFTSSTKMKYSSTSIGAELVNNITAIITNSLFVPNRPFFILDLSNDLKEELKEEGIDLVEVRTSLAAAENAMIKRGEAKNTRPLLQQAVKGLVVTGNALLHKDTNGDFRRYNLSSYVLERAVSGKLLKVIVEEKKTIKALPEDLYATLTDQQRENPDDTVNLYTGMYWDRDMQKYIVKQAVEDVPVDFESTHPESEPPFIAPSWNLLPGEHYGRGLVEEYWQDLQAVDELNSKMSDYISISTFIRLLVDPSGLTDINKVVEGVTDTTGKASMIAPGRDQDISMLQTSSKLSDFQFVDQFTKEKILRLARAFMLGSLTTRDAERVTAEEIRRNANELENNFGGIYSALSNNLQLPYARMLVSETDITIGERSGIELIIVAGIDALARASEHDNMLGFLNDLSIFNQVQPEFLQVLNIQGIITQLAIGRNVSDKEVLKTTEEITQEQTQAQEQELVGKVTDAALGAASTAK